MTALGDDLAFCYDGLISRVWILHCLWVIVQDEHGGTYAVHFDFVYSDGIDK